MKIFKKILGALFFPFVAVAVLIVESKEINEDGSWNKYHMRRNRRELKKGN